MILIRKIRGKAAFYHGMIAIVLLCGFLFTDSEYARAGSGKNINIYARGSGKTAGISNADDDVNRQEPAVNAGPDSADRQKYTKSERIGIVYTGDSRIRRPTSPST